MSGATFGQLQARVAARLIDPNNQAVSAANVSQAIQDAIDYWKQKKFYFNQRVANLVMDTTAATDGSATSDPFILLYGQTNSLYPNAPVLPQYFLYEDPDNGFVIPYSNINYTMEKVAPEIYDNANINGVGLPYIYCFRNNAYQFYFLPQIAYTMRVNYITDYAPLVNTSDTNDFTTYADKLIEYDAIARLLADLRLDEARADKFSMRRDEEYRNLQTRSRKQNATGRLVVDTLLA